MKYFQFESITKEYLVKLLVLALSLFVITYSLVLLSLTGNAISLKKVTLQIKKTETEIARTERSFSKTLGELNAASFQSFGFTTVGNSSFAVKKDAIASFSVLYER